MKNEFFISGIRLLPRLLLSFLPFIVTGQAAEGDNLLQNGQLTGSSSGVPGWNYRSAHTEFMRNGCTPDSERGSSFYIKIIAPDEKGANEWLWQEINCEPGAIYQLSFSARSDGNEHKAEVGVDLAGGAKGHEYRKLVVVADSQSNAPKKFTTPEWKDFSAKFTIPAGVTKLTIRLGLQGKDVSEAWYRDVKLEKQ